MVVAMGYHSEWWWLLWDASVSGCHWIQQTVYTMEVVGRLQYQWIEDVL